MDLFPDNISFGQFLRVASPGDRYCYFVGDLAQFRFSAGKEMEAGALDSDFGPPPVWWVRTLAILSTADEAQEGGTSGLGHLFQRRVAPEEFEYYYQMRKRKRP